MIARQDKLGLDGIRARVRFAKGGGGGSALDYPGREEHKYLAYSGRILVDAIDDRALLLTLLDRAREEIAELREERDVWERRAEEARTAKQEHAERASREADPVRNEVFMLRTQTMVRKTGVEALETLRKAHYMWQGNETSRQIPQLTVVLGDGKREVFQPTNMGWHAKEGEASFYGLLGKGTAPRQGLLWWKEGCLDTSHIVAVEYNQDSGQALEAFQAPARSFA